MGERVLCKHEVVGSIPSSSTTLPCRTRQRSKGRPDQRASHHRRICGWLRISDIVKRECALAVAKAAGQGAFGKHKAVDAKAVAAGLIVTVDG